MTSWSGMHMHSSREGVCGNNIVQFQSCDGSSYCTALGKNGCTDIVSCQLQDSCSYQISACSEAISSRDPLPIVQRVWTWHYEQQYGQMIEQSIHWRPNQCAWWRPKCPTVPGDARTDGKCAAELAPHNFKTLWSILHTCEFLSDLSYHLWIQLELTFWMKLIWTLLYYCFGSIGVIRRELTSDYYW